MATSALNTRKAVHRDRLNIVQLCLTVLSSVIALLIVGRHVGVMPISCGWACQEVAGTWYSKLFEFAAVTLSLGGVLAIVTRARATKALFVSQGCCALVAFVTMISTNHFCPLCLGLQFAWLASALSVVFVRYWSVIPVLVASLGVWILGAEASDNVTAAVRKNAAFEFRDYEPMTMKGGLAAYAIFTDPLCPACRSAAKRFYAQQTDVPIVYRWKPLTQHGDDAVRYCAALESALSADFGRGLAAIKNFYLAETPNDDALVKAGTDAGFEEHRMRDWLESPDPSSLNAIERDTEYAKVVGVTKVPTIRQVSTMGQEEPKIRSYNETLGGLRAKAEYEPGNLKPFEVFYTLEAGKEN